MAHTTATQGGHPRAPRTRPIQSLDDIEVEVIYAEPSEETERILDDVVQRIWEFEKGRGFFMTQ